MLGYYFSEANMTLYGIFPSKISTKRCLIRLTLMINPKLHILLSWFSQ